MHKITIDGLSWTSKDEIEINGVCYIKKPEVKVLAANTVCKARISEIQPCYGQNGFESLKLVLNAQGLNSKMPTNSKILRPGDMISIVKGDIK